MTLRYLANAIFRADIIGAQFKWGNLVVGLSGDEHGFHDRECIPWKPIDPCIPLTHLWSISYAHWKATIPCWRKMNNSRGAASASIPGDQFLVLFLVTWSIDRTKWMGLCRDFPLKALLINTIAYHDDVWRFIIALALIIVFLWGTDGTMNQVVALSFLDVNRMITSTPTYLNDVWKKRHVPVSQTNVTWVGWTAATQTQSDYLIYYYSISQRKSTIAIL